KINSLREFDWYQFKQERRFKERESVYNESFFINVSNKTIQSLDLSNLLNNLDDAILYRCILKSDIVTKKIINLKVNDYSTKEIAKILDITPNVIYKKIYFLRKKYRKLAKFKRY
ncbi:sigma-70 family RNA polymerase sigma factor, partial [Faecalitalea cylindroides]